MQIYTASYTLCSFCSSMVRNDLKQKMCCCWVTVSIVANCNAERHTISKVPELLYLTSYDQYLLLAHTTSLPLNSQTEKRSKMKCCFWSDDITAIINSLEVSDPRKEAHYECNLLQTRQDRPSWCTRRCIGIECFNCNSCLT